MSLNKELEVKFKVDNLEEIKEKIISLGGVGGEEVFQKTIRLDTPNDDLMKRGIFLRTRKEEQDIMTVKIKKKENKKLFERDEYEIKIEDADKTAAMLKILGFSKERILEKYRTTFDFKKRDVKVMLDRLPFGNYMEIEGETEADIDKMITDLDLPDQERIVNTYWGLLKEIDGPDKKDAIFRL